MKNRLLRIFTILPIFITSLLTSSCNVTILRDLDGGVFAKRETIDNKLILRNANPDKDSKDKYELHLEYMLLSINVIEEETYISYVEQNKQIENRVNDIYNKAKKEGLELTDEVQNSIKELYKNRHALVNLNGNYFEFRFNICFTVYEETLDSETGQKKLSKINEYSDKVPEMSYINFNLNFVSATYLGFYKQNTYDYFFALDKADPTYTDKIKGPNESSSLMLVVHVDNRKTTVFFFSQKTDTSSLDIRWESPVLILNKLDTVINDSSVTSIDNEIDDSSSISDSINEESIENED